MPDLNSVESFQSSIKIKGLHFLPPVITGKRSLELQRYKQQAVKLEKRLETCRVLRKNLQELLVLQPFSEHYQSSESDSNVEADSFSSKKTDFNQRQRRPTLSCDIIDVTEYSTNGIKILDKISNKADTSDESFKSINLKSSCSQEISNTNLYQDSYNQFPPTDCYDGILDTIDTNLSRLQSVTGPSPIYSNSSSPINLTNHDSPPPRLIRSNSYILENPSPILLAHLDKFSQNNKIENNMPAPPNINALSVENIPFEKSEISHVSEFSQNNKSESQLLASPNKNVLSVENIPFEKSEFSHASDCKKTAYENPLDLNEKQSLRSELVMNSSPKIEVIQTDISVQHITVDCDKNTCEETDMQKSSLELIDPNCQLLHVLKSIPEDYSKKILDLIEKQQIEQCNEQVKRINSENITNNNLNQNDYTNGSLNCDNTLDNQVSLCNNISHSSTIQDNDMSLSESVNCLSSESTALPTSSIQIVSFEYEEINPEVVSNSPYIDHVRNHIDIIHQPEMENCRRKLSFSKERFKQLNAEITTIKQEWAASIIGAHVKGYLTRRLLKTERIQSLINTIKDALICALQLHSADNIDESDVELHRRLINQVTAACYTFHDIFFALTIPEQMAIISTDRRRKLEKEKRPLSAPALRQSRSATKLKPRTSLSQSLTKV